MKHLIQSILLLIIVSIVLIFSSYSFHHRNPIIKKSTIYLTKEWRETRDGRKNTQNCIDYTIKYSKNSFFDLTLKKDTIKKYYYYSWH